MSEKKNKIELLKTCFFVLYPCITVLLIPFCITSVLGDGTVYRTEFTFFKIILIILLNGPLYYLFMKALPKNPISMYLHLAVIVIILFILPALSTYLYILVLTYYQIIAFAVAIDLATLVHHKRTMKP